jgi:glycosyltransferase involved in cell wall biosynthesis
MRPRIMLISAIHPATDPRIVYKIAPSLTAHYEVFCVLPGAEPIDTLPEVRMVAVTAFHSLLLRICCTHAQIFWQCLKLRPNVIHVFVPELIPLALICHWFGVKVIYEVQENLFKKFEIKRSNNNQIFQNLFRYFDQAARRSFHFIFTDRSYLHEYNNLRYPSALVQNYVSLPVIDRYRGNNATDTAIPKIFYSGVISMERSFDTLVSALVLLKSVYPKFRMYLFGPVRFKMEVAEQLPGYHTIQSNLTFYGYTDFRVLLPFARECIAGIALLKPVADYQESYSTKLFEYMALSLPVITSDFPLYKEVIEENQCGFCIAPTDAVALAETLKMLISNPEKAKLLGRNGRDAAMHFYNWESEEKELRDVYSTILDNKIET